MAVGEMDAPANTDRTLRMAACVTYACLQRIAIITIAVNMLCCVVFCFLILRCPTVPHCLIFVIYYGTLRIISSSDIDWHILQSFCSVFSFHQNIVETTQKL